MSLNIVAMKESDMDGILEQVQDSYSSQVFISPQNKVKAGFQYILTFENENSFFEVAVIFASFEHYSQVGIHLKEADEYSLGNAIEKAERDGFETIYIHSLAE